eukprot:10271293-Alexandrium_andersonii.AAC.1
MSSMVTGKVESDECNRENSSRAFEFSALLLSDVNEMKSLAMQLMAVPRQESLHAEIKATCEKAESIYLKIVHELRKAEKDKAGNITIAQELKEAPRSNQAATPRRVM